MLKTITVHTGMLVNTLLFMYHSPCNVSEPCMYTLHMPLQPQNFLCHLLRCVPPSYMCVTVNGIVIPYLNSLPVLGNACCVRIRPWQIPQTGGLPQRHLGLGSNSSTPHGQVKVHFVYRVHDMGSAPSHRQPSKRGAFYTLFQAHTTLTDLLQQVLDDTWLLSDSSLALVAPLFALKRSAHNASLLFTQPHWSSQHAPLGSLGVFVISEIGTVALNPQRGRQPTRNGISSTRSYGAHASGLVRKFPLRIHPSPIWAHQLRFTGLRRCWGPA